MRSVTELHHVRTAFVLAAVLASASDARADAAGDAALAQMDAALGKATGLVVAGAASTKQPDGRVATASFTITRKLDKSVLALSAPEEGTKALYLSRTAEYVYLPSTKKIVPVSKTPAAADGALGLAFSYEDLLRNRYGDQYSATIASDSSTTMKLTLVPKSGVTTTYSKLVVTVAKDHMLPSELQYFDAAGAPVKTETRTSYTCQGDVCTPTERKMVTTGGAATTLTRRSSTVNPDLEDALFSPTTFAP